MAYPSLRRERVLQFGTGILLRGLPDYFIDQAIRDGRYDGSIVVVKSTNGPVPDLSQGFATMVRGIRDGKKIEEDFINRSISRILSAESEWKQIQNVAQDPALSLILSNTTEAGLVYRAESIFQSPPTSFPAKLTAILFERFQSLGGGSSKVVVIPTELIPDNGAVLKNMVHRLIEFNKLDPEFERWIDSKIIFCSSLVDRIVTRPAKAVGQIDRETIQAEPYKLWAIEGDEEVRMLLPMASRGDGMIVASEISYYRERKLRLLNGTHSLLACHGFLSGFNTVYECMQDRQLRQFVTSVMNNEILPTVTLGSEDENREFATEVIDRFDNPFTEHKLLSIAFQSTLKMKMRNVPVLLSYIGKQKFPREMAKGFASYLLFMRAVVTEAGVYYGIRKGERYEIKDDSAEYFYKTWQRAENPTTLVNIICSNKELWGADLTSLSGFKDQVVKDLETLISEIDEK